MSPFGLEHFAGADVRFEDGLLLDVEGFERSAAEASDGGVQIGVEVDQGEEEVVEGLELDVVNPCDLVGVVVESRAGDEDALIGIGASFIAVDRLHLGGKLTDVLLSDLPRIVLALHEGADLEEADSELQADVELHGLVFVADGGLVPLETEEVRHVFLEALGLLEDFPAARVAFHGGIPGH